MQGLSLISRWSHAATSQLKDHFRSVFQAREAHWLRRCTVIGQILNPVAADVMAASMNDVVQTPTYEVISGRMSQAPS